MPTISRVTGIDDKFTKRLSGTPDMLLTALICLVAGAVVYLALTLPPGAKPALLAYIILP